MLGDFSSGKERIFTSLRQYQKLIHIAKATRKNALFVLASGNTGVGKTTAMRQLYAEAPHTFYIKIEDDLTWRELLRKIAISLGIKDLPYRTEALREAIQQRVELLANEYPLLIIDEAEELTDSVARKLKRLHTLTEGQLGVLIVAHPNLRRRLARASGLNPDTGQPRSGRPETQYATLWRRLSFFDVPPVSDEDIAAICKEELRVRDNAVVALAQERWTNYGAMAKDISVAAAADMQWTELSPEDFQFIIKT